MDHGDRSTDEYGIPGGRPASGIADAPLIASGRRLGERFRLERMLGHGGMAAVWLATDERLDRQVAVKVLSDTLAHDSEYLGRFRREAHVAAGLQHPNLVPVYDFGSGDRPYLVMEYIPGGDLAERIKADRALDVRALAAELLSALRHIHAAGVLHRDIKPQNVLVDADGRARLTDFGIAQPSDATSFTRTGQVIGTESYLAPEVMRGDPASERSDLYALGVVLAAAGDRADHELWELIERLRDRDPLRRPRSAATALAALERGTKPTAVVAQTTQPFEIEAADEPPADPETAPRSFEPTPRPARRSSRGRRALGLAALAAVIVAVVVGLALGSGGGDGGSGATLAGDSSPPSGGGKADSKPPPDEAATTATTTAETTTAETTPAETTTSEATTAPVSSTDGVELNGQGYDLLQSGDPAGAVPILQRAVDALEGSGDEQTYNYALFNLGSALRQSGDPEAAIPILQQRLAYPDQTETVQAELDQACQEAGVDCSESKPGKGPKAPKE